MTRFEAIASSSGKDTVTKKTRRARQDATTAPPACDISPVQPLHDSRLQTKRELAAYLTVSVRTVERLLAQGLPAVTICGIRRFDRVEVMAWLRKKERRIG